MYFLALQRLHHSLPTAKLLADADVSCSTALLSSASTSRCVADRVTPQITPSADTTYSLSELVAALAFNDHKPMVCRYVATSRSSSQHWSRPRFADD
jgi:hypothetical protein